MKNKARLTNIFGLKLLPVSGEMTKTAKNMLDSEIEYIDYLRRRKKFFVMTQIQQTRVTVIKKTKEKRKKEEKKRGGFRFPWWRRRKKKVKSKVKVRKKKTFVDKLKQKGRIKGKKVNANVRKSLKKIPPANKIVPLDRVKPKKIPAYAKNNKATKLLSQGGDALRKTGTSLLEKPGKIVNKFIPKSAKKKVVEELTERAAKKTVQNIAKKQVSKQAAKIGTKAAIKIGLKKIPFGVSAVFGLGFGIQRLMQGDIKGALMETASGIAATIPGPGSAISAGLDAALIAKDITGMKDGGQVSSPTQALIAEGGEAELVVPHSKLGPVFQSLLKQVGMTLTDVTTGFLSTLPVPSSAASSVQGEAQRLAGVFGGMGMPEKVFKGGKITKAVGGFLKKMGGGALGLAKNVLKATPMGMAAGAVGSMFNRPAKAEPKVTTRIKTSSFKMVNGQIVENESFDSANATSVGDFPITDVYGSTENRSKPHGGVDVGTPVGTPVGFNESGKILAAGKFGGYGNLMDVWLPQTKIQMRIAHLSKFIKKTGQFIAGEKLAETGGAVGDPGAGSSTGPHLHFEYDVKENSTRYGGAGDPMPYAPLINLSAVEAPADSGTGGPSLGASYGHPLQYTVKWPSSGGSMGGPGLLPNIGSAIAGFVKKQIMPVPVTIPFPVPVPVEKVVTVTKEPIKKHGIDSFSGKYVEL
mgnify:FL=1|tara:strand:- start:824 stop:2908 length:2085 start_codon:yes stop_codon:yes gene_type:complete